ncbi:ATP-dependent nuclease [Candidatus Nanohalovita haloferacivicina]|uniref:ATP-dependent nuclease n=1 Tax=Candidatus Nanohalovita haloferacivicina TaxID=2978046 RepID=UPI00325FB043|nr:Putative ATP-dependent endonuclease [Candidatus Nanohalobia archaeon BNXNv]
MKLISFNINDYRSIDDSGECYLSPSITILAGKNEAGKTSILEALESFNFNQEIDDGAKPIGKDESLPKISLTFEISEAERSLFNEVDNSLTATITKVYPNTYNLDKKLEDVFPGVEDRRKEMSEKLQSVIASRKGKIEKFSSIEMQEFLEEDNISNAVPKIIDELERAISSNNNNQQANELKEVKEKIKGAYSDFLDYKEFDKFIRRTDFSEALPKFILFDSVEDNIPNEVGFYDLKDNNFVQDLSKISDLDPEIIKQDEDNRAKRKHKKKVNLKLNEDYEQFWTQDASKLSVDWDSDSLYFWIEEGAEYYEPSIRSKGKQWHLSFYTKLTAHANERNPPIVLIDDPGIHLHKKAQEDILRKLESLSEETKVVFTTHSPYLIDPNKLNRIRLIEKENSSGTEISKIHAGADYETLSPILTAMGAAPSLGLEASKKNTVVVEGISDYYYLQAFRELIEKTDSELNVVPSTGDTTMLHIAPILYGWGTDPIFLLDEDSSNGIGDKLMNEEELGISEDKIVSIPVEDGAIEDVFTEKDFKKHVLESPKKQFKSKNSMYMKRANKSKALSSKLFYEKVLEEDIDLEETTLQNIKKIFGKIDRARDSTSYIA